MRRIPLLVLAALLAAFTLWPTQQAEATTPPLPRVPTTRLLAIGTVPAGTDPAKVLAILPDEIKETANLYLEGQIDQWYSLQGRLGVVFILNVTDQAEARAMLDSLPLGQAHLMQFELMPLGPLNPLHWLPGMMPR